MGASTKKQSSTTNSNFSSTQTPTNPDWVTNGLAGIGGNISNLSNLDPYSFVAGANPLQTQAGGTAAGLGGTSGAVFRGALDGTGAVMGADMPQTSAVQASGYIPQYMNPYTDAVVKSSLAGYDQNSNLQNQQANLDLAGDSTFGGSGGSIYKALLAGQQGLGRGQLEAGLRDQGFQTALGAAQADAARQQSTNDANAQLKADALQRQLAAAGQLGSLGTALDANTRANIGAQAGIGGDLRDIAQQQVSSPLALLGLQSSLFSGLPLNLLHGQNTTGTQSGTSTGTESGATLGDWLNYFASNAKAAASAGGG